MNGYYDRPLAPSIDTVKTILHDYGPATLSIATHTSSTHVTDDTFYTDSPDSIDHAVLIVGWDDDFARENFDDGSGIIPEANGAWLIENSWGTGDNGYYWVSYEDASAVYGACYQLESAENYDVNYQFDTLGWVTSLSVEDGTAPDAPGGGAGAVAYMANIFTVGADGTVSPDEDAAAEDDEELSAVSFYTTDENASYAVSVYRGPEAGDPASGTLVGTQEDFEEYPGYHTVELGEDLRCRLTAGDTFSVVVRLRNPVYENPIPAEGTGLGGTVEPEYLGRNEAGVWRATCAVPEHALESDAHPTIGMLVTGAGGSRPSSSRRARRPRSPYRSPATPGPSSTDSTSPAPPSPCCTSPAPTRGRRTPSTRSPSRPMPPPSTPRPRRSPSMRTCIPCTPRTAPSCTTGTRSPPGPCPTRRTVTSWR